MRAFVPAVSCPSCSHPNDDLFLLCQMCGYRRKTVPKKAPSSKISVDLKAIDYRLEHLKNASLQSSYSKQKCSLRTEFETFLASLLNSKTILSASRTDITRFLVWKDRYGKTVEHSHWCPDSKLQSTAKCKCPKRLAHKTIDSYIGKLRAIFKEAGRCGDWNLLLGLGNSAASLEVQKYLKASTEEQLRAHITPKQEVPLFLTKLLLLARYMNRKIAERSVNPSGLFVLGRDQAFFKALFFSGDRGSDLGTVRKGEIVRFPQNVGCCLITYGEKPCGMALPMCSEFGDIPTLSCVRLKSLKHMLL